MILMSLFHNIPTITMLLNLTLPRFMVTTQHPLRMSSFLTVLRQQVLH